MIKPNWLGRQFEIIMDNGEKCVALMGTRAMAYVPVKVKPNTQYEIEFLAKKESGNGVFFANLYGGKKYDFSQAKISCDENWKKHTVKIYTEHFPVNHPITFRLWKDAKSTGTTLIKEIKVAFLQTKAPKIVSKPGPATQAVEQIRMAKRNQDNRLIIKKSVMQESMKKNEDARAKVARDASNAQVSARRHELKKNSPYARVTTPARTIIRPDYRLTKFKPMEFVTHFPDNLHSVKVLYLPANNDQIKQTGVEDAFVQAGFQLCSFDFRNCNNYRSPLICEQTFLKTIRDYKPDWIHMQLQYTGFIHPRNLQQIKKEFPHTVITNWSGDVRDFANMYFVQCGEAIDLSLMCNQGQLKMFKDKGLKRIQYWQIGIDPKQTFRMEDNSREALRKVYNHDIVFCASYTSKFPDSDLRAKCVNAFTKKFGNKFAVYGTNWDRTPSFRGYLPYYDQNKIYNGSRIALSVNHFNNIRKYFSDRQLLTTGSGTMSLCHYIPGLEDYFENGKEVVWFKTIPEALNKAAYYLKHPKEADEIGRRGAEKVLKEHSYLVRVMELSKRLKISTTPPEKPKDMSMVMGTHNRLDLLKKVVAAAKRSAKGCDYEIVINDAGSTDGTIEWLKAASKKDKRVVPIFGKKAGITLAYNQCFEKAKGKYLIWLSDDTIPVGTAILNMFNLMEKKPENIMGAFETRNDPSMPFMVPMHGSLYMPIVACVRKSYMQRIGYWNMDFPYYGQDSEWNARVYRTGGRIIPTKFRVDHLNCQDDLKSSNLENYKKDGFFEKYRLMFPHKFGIKSAHIYPILLLNIGKGTDYENVKDTVANIRKLYKNVNFAGIKLYADRLTIDFPNIHIVPNTVDREMWKNYDLIVNINDTQRTILLHNGVRRDTPFVRRCLYG